MSYPCWIDDVDHAAFDACATCRHARHKHSEALGCQAERFCCDCDRFVDADSSTETDESPSMTPMEIMQEFGVFTVEGTR